MKALFQKPVVADQRAMLAALPDDACITAAELAALAVCSVRHIDRLVKAGKTPPTITDLGRQVGRWRMGAVREWSRAG